PAFAPAWQSAAPAAPTAPEPTAPAPVAPPAFAPAFSSLADVTLPTPTEAVSEPTATPEPEAAPSSSPSWADASTWAAVTASAAPAEAAPSAPAEPVFAAPTPEPTFVAPTPEPEPAPPAPAVPATPPPAFASMDAYFAPADAAPAAPPDADDLTVIRGIDAEIQQKLYAAGVYHLDEMARWSRADARRISGAVGIPEETITHEWIFEAQSVLFDSYQQQMVPAARAVPA
ncbi:MAG TPA: hypothetical protein VK610_05830, partial [Rhodothermales bacterium]|nr:hypothetical protein [Rhodothermales bacterium]